MSDLISGKEAKLAWANGEIVGYLADGDVWFVDENTPLGVFDSFEKWQIKPRTITINGIEVPAPFEPKDDEKIWLLSDMHDNGYITSRYESGSTYEFGVWRTEDEIKQVVAALRSIFNSNWNPK